ncbi:MAG: winged helix-turn-helix domain-containing protein [Candidatus Odinarchaeota archaeon]
MDNSDMNLEVLQRELLRSTEQISDFIKTIGHSKRYLLLVLLMIEPKTFRFLKKEVNIEKTALFNHLTKLMKALLVEKIDHGTYCLTEDARDLLRVTYDVYHKSKVREYQIKRALQTQYSRSYQRMIKEQKKVIDPEPLFKPSWITYLGAFAGAFESLGSKIDTISVGGYSGYAFAVNVAKGRLCPSGPTALCSKTWEEIIAGTESFSGWKLRVISDNTPYPNTHPVDEADRERARELFNQIKKEIDEDERPVVLWGLPIPEYGIVKGYEMLTTAYLCSTYRHVAGIPETPVSYDAIQAPGSLHAFIFDRKVDVPENLDLETMKRALRIITDHGADPGYIAGPDAFKEWADVLENGTLDEMSYHGNSYTAHCYHEAKDIANKFLQRLHAKYSDNPQSGYLLAAAGEYEKAGELLKEFTGLFPFAMEGNITSDNRKKGAKMLRQVIPHEESAIRELKQVIGAWT